MSQIAFPTPEPGILARRDSILAGLAALLPAGSLITEEDERRPFETDALTAYRRLPLAVALPTSTDEVARVLKYCRDAGVYVVPRGAGTSLSGGAIPQEDAIVVGLSKMSRILEVNLADRYARVAGRRHQSGDFRGGRCRRVLLRSRPVLAARLHHRRQHRDEFGRRALPQIWRDDQ